MTEPYRLILGILAVWRITHLLHAEDGPWDVITRLRRAAGTGFLGGAMDCFHCLSLWIAAPAALIIGESRIEKGLLVMALSAGAILIECIRDRRAPAVYHEEQEK